MLGKGELEFPGCTLQPLPKLTLKGLLMNKITFFFTNPDLYSFLGVLIYFH